MTRELIRREFRFGGGCLAQISFSFTIIKLLNFLDAMQFAELKGVIYLLTLLIANLSHLFDSTRSKGSSIHAFVHKSSEDNMDKSLRTTGQKASISATQRQTASNLACINDDHLIVHPGALATILHLLTSINSCSNENVSSQDRYHKS